MQSLSGFWILNWNQKQNVYFPLIRVCTIYFFPPLTTRTIKIREMSFVLFDLVELCYTDLYLGDIHLVGRLEEAVEWIWFCISNSLHCFKLLATSKETDFSLINCWASMVSHPPKTRLWMWTFPRFSNLFFLPLHWLIWPAKLLSDSQHPWVGTSFVCTRQRCLLLMPLGVNPAVGDLGMEPGGLAPGSMRTADCWLRGESQPPANLFAARCCIPIPQSLAAVWLAAVFSTDAEKKMSCKIKIDWSEFGRGSPTC